MARDAVDIKERLTARVMRPRSVQRLHEDIELAAKDGPGNRRVSEQLVAEKPEVRQ